MAAEELKYVSALKAALSAQFDNPEDDFVKLLTGRVYDGAYTQKRRELFTRLTQKALVQFINDRVNDRLKSALGGAAPTVGAAPAVAEADAEPTQGRAADFEQDDVETTMEEIEGFHIVRAICASEVAIERVVARDAKSYFAVFLDDNNRKPICRLHFNRKQRYLGLFDADKVETKVAIERVEELYAHADQMRETVKRYL